ncbi:hypothetical protein DPMN_095988 [Dreissena polymorpha]|uniref:Uncharacterized protein n=1 Tax=Dreissena polymorpha TaxID=45954 RepID=A0A9D4L8Y0_DREPO|nr:hypothetical protein DPMN_095988 [Dreissena polymorpha]
MWGNYTLTVLSMSSLSPHVDPANLSIIASSLSFCFHEVWPPRLPLVKGDSQVHMSPILTVPAFCFDDNVNSLVDDFSLLIITHQSSAHAVSVSIASCILYVAVQFRHKEERRGQDSSLWDTVP